MRQVIFVPGLGDNNLKLSNMLRYWEREGIDVHIHEVPWRKRRESYEEKLTRLLKKIDAVTQNHQKVSLVGMSAGGSLILNAYALRKDKIHRIITISGRLLKGNLVFPTLRVASFGFPAFRDSVVNCEHLLHTFSKQDKAKILTTQSRFFDEAVPISTMHIPGVKTIKVAVPFHVASISATLLLRKDELIDFIKRS